MVIAGPRVAPAAVARVVALALALPKAAARALAKPFGIADEEVGAADASRPGANRGGDQFPGFVRLMERDPDALSGAVDGFLAAERLVDRDAPGGDIAGARAGNPLNGGDDTAQAARYRAQCRASRPPFLAHGEAEAGGVVRHLERRARSYGDSSLLCVGRRRRQQRQRQEGDQDRDSRA